MASAERPNLSSQPIRRLLTMLGSIGLCCPAATHRNRRLSRSPVYFLVIVLFGASSVVYFRPSASLVRRHLQQGGSDIVTHVGAAGSGLSTLFFRQQTSSIVWSGKQRANYNNISRNYDDDVASGKVIGVFTLIDVSVEGQGRTEIERLTNQEFGFDSCDSSLHNHVTGGSSGGYRLYNVFLKGGDSEPNATDKRSQRIETVQAYLKERVRLAEERGCHVTIAPPVNIDKQGNDLNALNRAMMDSYLVDGVDYYHVILPTTQPAIGSYARNVHHLVNVLRYYTDPYETGIVVEDDESVKTMQTTNAPAARAPKAIFFSRVHFDIFGLFFPLEIPDVPSAIQAVIDVYQSVGATKGGLVAHVTAGNDAVNLEKKRWNGGNSTAKSISNVAESNWPEVIKQNSETLNSYLTALRSSHCFRCPHSQKSSGLKKVISMSLYGSDRRYTMGAIRNAQMAPVTYPGWTLRFYAETPGPDKAKYGNVPPGIISRLVQLGAEIQRVSPDANGHLLAPMLWRFTVIDDPTVEIFTIRDCDSRLTPRDAAVVADWLRQNPAQSVFHCIRDHPSHSLYSVSGGLWGARRSAMAAVFNGSFIASMKTVGAGYVEDMHFLGRDVWPKVKANAYCHDSFSCQKYESSHPFPVRRIGSEHLGQVYNEFSVGRQGDMNILLNHAVVQNCVPS